MLSPKASSCLLAYLAFAFASVGQSAAGPLNARQTEVSVYPFPHLSTQLLTPLADIIGERNRSHRHRLRAPTQAHTSRNPSSISDSAIVRVPTKRDTGSGSAARCCRLGRRRRGGGRFHAIGSAAGGRSSDVSMHVDHGLVAHRDAPVVLRALAARQRARVPNAAQREPRASQRDDRHGGRQDRVLRRVRAPLQLRRVALQPRLRGRAYRAPARRL